MRVRFLGPIERVTGSCSWIVDDDTGFEMLVDCGMLQGEPDENGWNEGRFPFEPGKLKCVVLTHAHIDHCGLLPLLYKQGFTGTVFATRETAALAQLVLEDAAKQRGAPYTQTEVDRVLFHEPAKDAALVRFAPIHKDVFVSFYRTGHIVGAVSVRLMFGPPTGKQTSITFSGDVGPNEENTESLPLVRFRMNPLPADYAVVESTYGDRRRPPDHHDLEQRLSRLRNELERIASDGGVLVVPAFAIDRTQAVLIDLAEVLRRDRLANGRLAEIDVVMHAPLATRVGDVYAEAMRRKTLSNNGKLRPYWLGKGMFRMLGLDAKSAEHERFVELYLQQVLSANPPDLSAGDRAGLDRLIPGWARPHRTWRKKGLAPMPARATVLVTGGGMCDGGPVLGYLPSLLRRRDVTIALTGYASGGTLGSSLLHLAQVAPEDRIRLSEELRLNTFDGAVAIPRCDVVARILALPGYSAHADQDGLVRWVVSEFQGRRSLAGRTVFVQHGQSTARNALAERLRDEVARVAAGVRFAVELPDSERWFDLGTGTWRSQPARTRNELESENARLREMLRAAGVALSP